MEHHASVYLALRPSHFKGVGGVGIDGYGADRLRAAGAGDTLKYGDVMSKQSTLEEPTAEKKLVLKPPVRREDLLRFTEEDPEGAEEFLELLREFREDRQSRPEPT